MITKFLQNSRISTLFFERDGHLHYRTMKVKFGLPFLSARIHRKVMHVNFFVFFSRHIAGPLFFKIQKFCYHGNETLRLFLSIVPCRKTTRGSYYLHGGTVWGLDIETQMSHAVLFRIKLRVRSIGKSGFRFSKSKSGFANRTRNPKTDFTSEKSVLRVDFN